MELKDIKELIKYFDKSNLGELEIEHGEVRLYLSKHCPNEAMGYMPQMVSPMQYGALMQPSQAPQPMQAAQGAQDVNLVCPDKANIIESPMIGTYYESSAPGAQAFVQAGDIVEKGQTLCIIEAMKIMNTIEAEYRCKIVKLFGKNGSPVEYGQDLFLVEPM